MKMNPYLMTNGNGQEAVAFYQKALNAKVMGLQTFGEMPADPNHPVPEGLKDKILHAMLKIGESILMLSDTFPGSPYKVGVNHLSIALMVDSADQAKEAFGALSEGGKVSMPLQQTFWSPAYGKVIDKFGVEWQISAEGQH
jgi:PhnB protein